MHLITTFTLRFDSVMLSVGSNINSKIQENNTEQVNMALGPRVACSLWDEEGRKKPGEEIAEWQVNIYLFILTFAEKNKPNWLHKHICKS
jgi:hypothetical protein